MNSVLGGCTTLSSGHDMPMIGLGTSGIKDADSMSTAVLAALHAGYRLFDTAHGYGNEAMLGQALADHLPSTGFTRSDIFITTKVPIADEDTDRRTRAMLDQSLTDLRTPYIDLVLIHYPRHLIGGGCDHDGNNNTLKRRTVWSILEEYVGQAAHKGKEAGRIKSIGVSNYEIYHMLEFPEYAKIACSVNQSEYHPHLAQAHLRSYCSRTGVFFQAFASLCSGDEAILQEEKVVSLARDHDVTAQTILLAFALHTGVGVIPKSTNPQRIESNIKDTVRVALLDDDVVSLLNLDRRQSYVGRCTPWRTL